MDTSERLAYSSAIDQHAQQGIEKMRSVKRQFQEDDQDTAAAKGDTNPESSIRSFDEQSISAPWNLPNNPKKTRKRMNWKACHTLLLETPNMIHYKNAESLRVRFEQYTNIYEAADAFGYVDKQYVSCTPAALLCLPLSTVFTSIPSDYWITRSRHKKLRMSQFLKCDHCFGCIGPLLPLDQPSSPRLVSKLRQDIHNRTIKLNQLIWLHILNRNQSYGEVDDSAFINAFCSLPQWIN